MKRVVWVLVLALFAIAAYALPTVVLNTPGNGITTANTTITFGCLASDPINLTNVTLYGDWTGSFLANETNSSGINNTSYIYNKALPDGTHTWNCEACDNSSACAFAAANFTLTVDTTPPNINSVAAAPTTSSATITWSTDENANSSVQFGTTIDLLDGSNESAASTTAHSLGVSGLTDSTVYFYNVTSCDALGNCNTTGPSNFTTLDGTLPVVTLNTPGNGISTANTTITFGCTASDNSNLSNVSLYGDWSGSFVEEQINTSGVNNTNYIFDETIPDGSFVWNCRACDEQGNCGFAPTNFTLTVDATPPNINSVVAVPTTSSGTITWSTDENANSSVQFGTTIDLLDGTNTLAAFVTSHNIGILGLDEGTLYFYNVTSCDVLNNCNTTGPSNFTILTDFPQFSGFSTSDNTYAFNKTYTFNIGVTDTNLDSVFLDINGTNASMTNTGGGVFELNATDLAAGNYTLTFYANDTFGNINTTIEPFEVLKADPGLILTLNGVDGNLGIESGAPVNLTGNATISEAQLNLTFNGTLVAEGFTPISNLTNTTIAGVYTVEVLYPGSENFTNSSVSHFLTITDTVIPVLFNAEPQDNTSRLGEEFELFTINITEFNFDLSTPELVYKRVGTPFFQNEPMVCDGTAPNYNCSTTINLTIFPETQIIYYFTADDNTGNTGTNGTALNPLTLIIDRSPPNVTGFTPPNGSYVNGSIDELFTTNVTDFKMNLTGYEVIYKQQLATNLSRQAGNCTFVAGLNYTCQANVDLFTNFLHGEVIIYFFNVTDAVNLSTLEGNESSPFSVTIDRTAPAVFNLSPTTVNVSQSNNFTANVSDDFFIDTCTLTIDTTTLNMTVNSTTNGTASVVASISNAGIFNYTVLCADGANNTNTSTGIIQTLIQPASVPTRGGGGGGNTFYEAAITEAPPATYEFHEQQVVSSLKVGESIQFSLDYVLHHITVLNITDNYVEFEVRSEPQKFKLKKGEQISVDIDQDGVKDIYIRVNDVRLESATFFIEKLKQEAIIKEVSTDELPPLPTGQIVSPPYEPREVPTTEVRVEQPEVFVTVQNTGFWILAVLLLAAIVGLVMHWNRVVVEIREKLAHIHMPHWPHKHIPPVAPRVETTKKEVDAEWSMLQDKMDEVNPPEPQIPTEISHKEPEEHFTEYETITRPKVEDIIVKSKPKLKGSEDERAGLSFTRTQLEKEYTERRKKLRNVQKEVGELEAEKKKREEEVRAIHWENYRLRSKLLSSKTDQAKNKLGRETTTNELKLYNVNKNLSRIKQEIDKKRNSYEQERAALNNMWHSIGAIDSKISGLDQTLKFHNKGEGSERKLNKRELEKYAEKNYGVKPKKKNHMRYGDEDEKIRKWKQILKSKQKSS